MKRHIICAGIFLAGVMNAGAAASPPDEMPPMDGLGSMGPERTRFEFSQSEASQWVNRYLEHFLVNRIDIGPCVFPREYLALSDSWLYDAHWGGRTVQQSMRFQLLDQQMTPEGYIMTQQHGATSHDHGWPFPHWSQVPGETGFRGVTAGWHFYDDPLGWEICYPGARGAAPEHFSEEATRRWGRSGLESEGIVEARHAWRLRATDGFPTLTSPEGVHLDPFNTPFVQIRWHTDGDTERIRPYMEWMREGDETWCESRRMMFYPDWLRGAGRSEDTGMFHSILPVYRHPKWDGTITRIRFCLDASDTPPGTFYVRSIFTAWDTRHLVNNAIHIKAAWEYFRWTGDLDFLRREIARLRKAMHFMMHEGHALELNRMRCTWHGHDGRPGYLVHADGSKTWQVGHGKGGNYWDLLPLGWDDMYTTIHYYASLLVMAQIEEAVAAHPGWDMPGGFMTLDPEFLREHAEAVKAETNRTFWNDEAGRFVGTIDADGTAWDFGFTFINLEAVHYGIANEENARAIMEWVDGRRIVEGDTSTGEDIYAYRLAPRATTLRNIEWYAHAWTGPETLPFGGQVQDGGAVLGFSFYDVMSRLRVFGADDAWRRLMAIREWDEEVQAYGGYRKYYAEGQGGTTLQGGGTAGGIGIDYEFTESSMLSAVIPFGFMGLRPDGQTLHIDPNLPAECPVMTVRNLYYAGVPLDITVTDQRVEITAHRTPAARIHVVFRGERFEIDGKGTFAFPE